MQRETITDWQSLTQLYGEMGDLELLELDESIGDLTDVAQQVLRDEMKKRRLSRTAASKTPPKPVERFVPYMADDSQTEHEAEPGDEAHEFTWKTPLCVCEDGLQAWQLREALRQAGVESWIEGAGFRVAMDLPNPRILVAADQLEEAREVAARPIPQAIIELSQLPPEEFELPVCPVCGAEDPLLESIDPVNSWLCETCGKQWTDPVEEDSGTAMR
jgi:hypothetical protein